MEKTVLEQFVEILPIRIKNSYSEEIEEFIEKEREQIITSFIEGADFGEMFNNENRTFMTDAVQYYEKTFKGKDESKTL